jgi:DNA mismatch repair protein MutS
MTLMQQYREAKSRHPGMLLLFRLGDACELFGEDAETAARVLGLTLTTSADKSTRGTLPMAGFPRQALEGHLRHLLQAGHRVAICEQVEDDRPEKPAEKTHRTLFDYADE